MDSLFSTNIPEDRSGAEFSSGYVTPIVICHFLGFSRRPSAPRSWIQYYLLIFFVTDCLSFYSEVIVAFAKPSCDFLDSTALCILFLYIAHKAYLPHKHTEKRTHRAQLSGAHANWLKQRFIQDQYFFDRTVCESVLNK